MSVTFCRASGQIGMSRQGSGIVRRILTAICLLIPLVASANPAIFAPSSPTFFVVVFYAFVVEAGIVALLLACRGVAPLRIFIADFVANAAVFFLLFQPLLRGSNSLPVPELELLVVLVDGLVIKVLVTLTAFRGDNFRGVSWLRSILTCGIGNGLSYFIGYLATQMTVGKLPVTL
jgi:hypothetical protein